MVSILLLSIALSTVLALADRMLVGGVSSGRVGLAASAALRRQVRWPDDIVDLVATSVALR